MKRPLSSLLLSSLVALAAGCWSLSGVYDPDRCDPPCGAGQVCTAGACKARDAALVHDAVQPEAGGDARRLDAGVPDVRADAPAEDGPGVQPDLAPDIGSDAGPDGPAPDAGAPNIAWTQIKKGTFMMGSPATEVCREPWHSSSWETQHQVTLTHDFELMTTEASQTLFQAVRGYNNSYYSPYGGGGGGGYNCPSCPVEYLNWYEAAAFCNALSSRSGLGQCYSCTGKGVAVTCKTAAAHAGNKIYACPGYRLPTDAEWEYAYRAGSTTSLYDGSSVVVCGYKGAGDPSANKLGWNFGNTNKPRPVGTLPANPWGLHNMAGNVMEWCHDEFKKDLGPATVTDPVITGTATTFHVLRGGSFSYPAEIMRAAMRPLGTEIHRGPYRGVRCARTR